MFKLEKEKSSKNTKYIATTILFFSMFLLLLFWFLSKVFPNTFMIPLMIAFFEASMVGGVADLFAIHVLFKHPFGLKIPHTAIIPKNKNRIGHAFSDFCRENFLSENYVKENIQKYNVSQKIGEFIEKHKILIGNKTIRVLVCFFEKYDYSELKSLINNKLELILTDLEVKRYFLLLLDNIKNKEQHHQFVNFSLEKLREWLDNPQNNEKVNSWIEAAIKSDGNGGTTFTGTIKSMFMGKQDLSVSVKELIDKINGEGGEEIKKEINKAFSKLITFISEDPIIDRTILEIKSEIIKKKKLNNIIDKLFENMREWFSNDIVKMDSKVRTSVSSIIDNLALRLKTDLVWQKNIQDKSIEYLPKFIVKNGEKIDKYIVNYIEKLNADEVSQLVKDKVGDDLQYIRINGSLVGGLVGTIWFLLEKGLDQLYPIIVRFV